MIKTGFESRVKIQQIINNQLPEFLLDENPKAADFLKQYYISQEYQGGPVDIAENLDQYLKLDNLTPEVVVDSTILEVGIASTDTTIKVNSTKGFPSEYGLLKIDNEIITYTGLTTNTFTGCKRGFSGITSYHGDINQEELVENITQDLSILRFRKAKQLDPWQLISDPIIKDVTSEVYEEQEKILLEIRDFMTDVRLFEDKVSKLLE